jgi:polar amino acid transport system permease protein
MYSWHFDWVLRFRGALVAGLEQTLLLTICSVILGMLVAVAVFLLRSARLPYLRIVAIVFIEVFRSLPVLVTLIWLYYALPVFIHGALFLSSFSVAALGLGLNYAALQAEIIRGGFESVPPGEIEAARGLGLSERQILRHISIPQAFWRSLAPTLGQAINTLKLTALASFIAVPELFYVASDLIKTTARPLEFYTVLAFCYLGLIWPMSLVVGRLEATLRERFQDA